LNTLWPHTQSSSAEKRKSPDFEVVFRVYSESQEQNREFRNKSLVFQNDSREIQERRLLAFEMLRESKLSKHGRMSRIVFYRNERI
jgi:hypothetical protein